MLMKCTGNPWRISLCGSGKPSLVTSRALAEQIQLYHTGIAAFAQLQICNLEHQRSVSWAGSGTSQVNEDALGTRIEDDG